MFLIAFLITLAFTLYLTVRDWMRNAPFSVKAIQKRLNRISQQISLEEWETAHLLLQPLLESHNGGRSAALFEIQVLRGTLCFEEAFSKVLASAREYPEELLFRLEEGKILLHLGRFEEALESFHVCEPILRTENDFVSYATAYLKSDFPTQAYDLLHPFLEHTQNGELTALAGDILFEFKQWGNAIKHYQKALAQGWTRHQVYAQLASSYQHFGNLSEAEKIFRQLLEKDPKDVVATLGLGMCLQERGFYQKAFLIYQTSPAFETRDAKLLKQLAICALKIKKYRQAERYLHEIITKEQPTAQLLAFYGFSLECQKKWQEAEQTYLRQIQLFPSHPYGFRGLAWLFGVGLSSTISLEQGLNYAYIALKLKNDLISCEILSACEARCGNFSRAYQIQVFLADKDCDKSTKMRRQQVLRKLRKGLPLDERQVINSLVA